MEVGTGSNEKIGFSPWWPFLGSLVEKLRGRVTGFLNKLKKIAKDDPRRIAHSCKVGLALTLVSFSYYVTPLFDGFGVSAIWAVLTVVVVMEYTVGATLSKGLNRAFATLLAAFLGVGAHQIAILFGEKGEPILLGLFVFILAAAATFSRFIPEIKARYDYGVSIFILTFSLVAVSSYRAEELIQLAHQRLSTIVIGVVTCLCTTIFVIPVWAGEDLHKLAAVNLDKLASFLEGLGSECLGEKVGSESLEGKPFLQVHKSVLNSKPTEDSLCNFARWEPGHGRFRFRHPWKQYLKIGALNRRCASSMEALTTYITTSAETQATKEPELRQKIRTACLEMSSESAKALRELSKAIRTMTAPASANPHMAAAIAATGELRSTLSKDADIADVLHVATIATLVAELVVRTQEIFGSVEELARLARFKSPEPIPKATVKPVSDGESPPHVAIQVGE
ncbi:aluminum-activated malate transporter 1-like [Phoenix dactylifera]|uniref:Aluminum-activated malate transporter 1-like n=1 Tax=Phoenix dactylifera TaxID=42345 RepID=A0A8B7CI08_PHODC|nr:aluminum-activated malate transporter 1-like [Phoenix dactylifera]